MAKRLRTLQVRCSAKRSPTFPWLCKTWQCYAAAELTVLKMVDDGHDPACELDGPGQNNYGIHDYPSFNSSQTNLPFPLFRHWPIPLYLP